MAQFTVYRNKSPRSRSTFPLLLDVQADLLEELRTRVVIPLTRTSALSKHPLSQLTPLVTCEGETYVLLTPQLAGIARSELGAAVGSLKDQRDSIIAAMDFLVNGF